MVMRTVSRHIPNEQELTQAGVRLQTAAAAGATPFG
jgi:hypothetical protein